MSKVPFFERLDNTESQAVATVNPLNIKRVLSKALRYWYLILLSVMVASTIGYLINRYSTRIYPVRASIIIRENEENAAAKFLYNNTLITPYRNFYNEIYIMKSYPLLQEVVEDLNFTTSYHREGDIKVTEIYEPDFPVRIKLISSSGRYDRTLNFTIADTNTYTLTYEGLENEMKESRAFSSLAFNDTIEVNGYRILVEKTGDVRDHISKTYMIRFHSAFDLAKSYSSRLSIDWAEQGASVVNLEIQGATPKKEIDFLNQFIERYQQYDVEKKNKASRMAILFLDKQLILVGDSLGQYENQVENFKRRNVTVDFSKETERLYQKILSFEEQKFQYQLLNNYSAYIRKLLETDQLDGIFTPSSVGIQDELIAGLINQLIEEQSQANLYISNTEKGADLARNNPAYRSKLQHIAFIKQDILKALDNTQKTQAINLQFIDDQIKLIESELRKLPSSERELITIERNYSLRENLYIFLLQKRTEAGLSEASTTSDIVVVNQPIMAGPVAPKTLQNYIATFFIGLMLPLLLFTLTEFFDDKIQSKEDIGQFTTVPVIGGIGHNPESESLIVLAKPRSSMAESFRALRSNLSYFTSNQNHQVFMVTSSIPGEGKSFTTLNLASVFALAGKRTLVIGADLRKPKLYEELQLSNEKGLSQYLSSMASMDEVLQKAETENLYFIAGGAMPPNPSELLIKPAMKDLIDKLRKDFDYIIMDTPPMGLITDAFVLAGYSDHILFVVRQGFTPKSILSALEENYVSGRMVKVSILFNDIRKTGMGYGYGNYGYGYRYNYTSGYGYSTKKKRDDGYYIE